MHENKHSILLVDDDAATKVILKKTLDREGFSVTAVSSADQARRELKQKSFDVLMTDLFMDGEDGFELLDVVKNDYPNTQLCAMTASPRSYSYDYVSEAKKKGAQEVFEKPINWQKLVPCLHALCAKKRGIKHVTNRRQTVLLVDDNEVIHWAYKDIFAIQDGDNFDKTFAAMFDSTIGVEEKSTTNDIDFFHDYRLEIASTRAEAIDCLHRNCQPKVSTVIMDINLEAEGDGIDAIKEILTIDNDINVIFSSSMTVNMQRAAESGLDPQRTAYLPKPFNKEDLISCLSQFAS